MHAYSYIDIFIRILNIPWPVFLIRSYGTLNGTGRYSLARYGVIRLGPHWHNSKITRANFFHAVYSYWMLHVTQQSYTILNIFGAVIKIQWLTHSLNWLEPIWSKLHKILSKTLHACMSMHGYT